MNRIEAVCRIIDRGAWLFAVAALSLMSALVIVDVATRYLIGFSFTWVEELTRYLMVWMTLIGSVSALYRGELIAVTFFKARLSPPSRRVVLALGHALVIIFLGLVLYYGVALVNRGWVFTTPALRIPFAWVYLAVPLSAFFMLIQATGLFLKSFGPPRPS